MTSQDENIFKPKYELRQEIRAIRTARRYLKANTGCLARVLNAYAEADAKGTRLGYLSDQ